MKRVLFYGLGAVVASAAALQTYPDCGNGPLAQNKVCDSTLSPAQRAAALVAAMTNDEKLQNLVSHSNGTSRLGLPAYNWWSEALHGVAYAPGVRFNKGPGPFNSSTSFPMPLLMAAAFDDDLIEKVGTVIGIEGRAFGNAGYAGFDYWTPNVNPFRDPRWGRGSETPGEDVLRVKRYAASIVRGLEGPGPQRRVVATCKHYAGYDLEASDGTDRHHFDARISLQDLAEYYLAPFQQCARDSNVGSIMCSYNAVNGVPACADPYLLETILRGHWNWTADNNYITSDCEAVADVSANHHYAGTNAQGTAMCFDAGMDSSCEYTSSSDIPGASSQGLLKWPTVDRALQRLYEGLVRAGYFDGGKAEYAKLGWSEVNRPESQQLALQAAVDGTVLLKNDGTLPLAVDSKHPPTVAMIGFWADAAKKQTGGYAGTPVFLHSPVYAAQQMGWNVTTATGPILQDSSASDNWTANALKAAQDADYILYFGGLDSSAAGEQTDRTSIAWPAAQLTLIGTLGRLGKPLVVVQLGDLVDDTPLLQMEQVNAILWANFPGQDGGTAMMQLISGAKSPAGRLPMTLYPSGYTRTVNVTNMSLRPSRTSPGRTYRWYGNPVRPFGFGLHYTTFDASFDAAASFPRRLAISDLLKNCTDPHPDTCPLPPLPVRVTNTGGRTSDYVALAFVAGRAGPAPHPRKTLVAYARVRDVAPGCDGDDDDNVTTTATVRLAWTLGDLARRDEWGDAVLYPGAYTLTLDEPARATLRFELVGEAPAVLDRWPAPPPRPANR